MSKRKKRREAAKNASQPTDAPTRYNLEREPLHSDRSTPRIEIPVHRTGWDWPRRRRIAAWLGVTFVILILVFGSLCLFYSERLWNIMIGRWQ